MTTITATGDMAQVGYRQNASLFAVFAFDETVEADSLPRRADERSSEVVSDGVQHTRVAHIPAGLGYVENFAISPDGVHVVGLNMAASWLPKNHPGRTDYSELSLFAFDRVTGALSSKQTIRLDGTVLPQGLAFDAAGRHLVVTSFQHDDREGGSLSFFRLDMAGAGEARLAPASARLAAPRGVHLVHVLR